MALSSYAVLTSHLGFTAMADGRNRKKVVPLAGVFTTVHDVRISDGNLKCCAAPAVAFRLDTARQDCARHFFPGARHIAPIEGEQQESDEKSNSGSQKKGIKRDRAPRCLLRSSGPNQLRSHDVNLKETGPSAELQKQTKKVIRVDRQREMFCLVKPGSEAFNDKHGCPRSTPIDANVEVVKR